MAELTNYCPLFILVLNLYHSHGSQWGVEVVNRKQWIIWKADVYLNHNFPLFGEVHIASISRLKQA